MTRSTINSRSIEGIHSIDATGTVTAAGLTVDTDTLHIDSTNNRVGIGTGSPSDTLEVSNNSSYQLRLSSAGENYQIGRNGSDGLLYFYGNQSGYTGYVFSGVNGERMRINSSGNVAIGITNPNEKLSVSGNIELYNDEQDGYIWFHDAGTRSWTIGSQQSTGSFVLTNAVDIGSGEKFVVTSSGSVGIGTTSPNANAKLTLSGSGLEVPTGYGVFNDTGGANATGINFTAAGSNVLSFYTGNSERMRITSSGNVGIGVVPETTYVQKTTLRLSTTASLIAGTSYYPYPYYIANNLNYDASDNLKYIASSGGALLSVNAHTGGSFSFYTAPAGTAGATASLTEKLRIDTAGNVTIQPAGTTTRSFGETVAIKVDQGAPTRLSVRNDSVNATASAGVTLSASGNSWAVECGSSAKNSNALTFAVDATAATPGLKMRLNTDGRWWVGQAIGTTLGGNGGEAVTGIMHYSTAQNSYTVIQSNGGNAPLYVAKGPNATGAGFIYFGENGSNTGIIGTAGSRVYFADNGQNTGISFYQACLIPTNINGTAVDNTYDCGHPSYRWDDIRATNGTIQTSDANEKQQIAALTDAEMTAAKAISALFKTFKWNGAVEAKGDAARTHAGVIAQDVEAAMTAAGLDAGDYAFFISDTWWETQTEVPAVDAVDAVLDEDGNVVTEAVEAVDAYTRTDTYDTAEEAPEGATERTRMGIRYPELFAFVGAATEQRLSNIETRLAALEAN